MCDIKKLSIQARKNLKYDSPLEPDSKMLVDLNSVRGDYNLHDLFWNLGISDDTELQDDNDAKYILFGGHRGCGKSTELRRLEKELHRPDRYFVVFVDALKELDINELRYSDILLAQAKVLFEKLTEAGVELDQVHLTCLQNWFDERVENYEDIKALSAEIKTGIKTKVGFPYIASLFASLTTILRFNSTLKTTVRKLIRNSFTEFADAFNALLQHAETNIAKAKLGQKLLFIVDGTDRLQGEDADYFFIRDANQLKLIRSNFIYCTPIDLLSERGVLRQNFESLERLPMIKLTEKGNNDPLPGALQQLRKLVELRMSLDLFEQPSTLDRIIKASGGHIRDLIRLLNYCLAETRGRKKITFDEVDIAERKLATEYRRLIEQEDYSILIEIDKSPAEYTPYSDQTRRLLYDLVLLEYNKYWWQTHPAVRSLDAYKNADNTA